MENQVERQSPISAAPAPPKPKARRRRRSGTGTLFRHTYLDRHGVERESKVWSIDYKGADGRRVRESTDTTDKDEAQEILSARVNAVKNGTATPDRKVTFERLIELIKSDYIENGLKSLHSLDCVIKRLTRHFGGWKARDITTDTVATYRSKRLADGMAPASVNRELSCLRRCFTLARERGLVAVMPVIKCLKENNAKQGFFEAGDCERVLKQLSERKGYGGKYLVAPLRVAYLTGWRLRSEVLSRQKRHFDPVARVLRLDPRETKNGEGREFPTGDYPELDALIEEQLERSAALEKALGKVIPHLFHDDEGNPIGAFRKRWLTATKAAGIPTRITKRGHKAAGLTPHDERRSGVRNMERAGIARSVAMDLVGHRTQSIYSRYAIGDAVTRKEGVKKLAAFTASMNAEVQPPKVVSLDDRREAASGD
jgi:site-specific recombinase XerD